MYVFSFSSNWVWPSLCTLYIVYFKSILYTYTHPITLHHLVNSYDWNKGYKKESQNIRFLTTEQICFLVYTKIPNFLCFCISLYISLFLSVSPPLLLYIAFLPVNVWHSAFHFPNEKKISLILHGILHLLSQHLLHQVCFYIFGLSSVYPELTLYVYNLFGIYKWYNII